MQSCLLIVTCFAFLMSSYTVREIAQRLWFVSFIQASRISSGIKGLATLRMFFLMERLSFSSFSLSFVYFDYCSYSSMKLQISIYSEKLTSLIDFQCYHHELVDHNFQFVSSLIGEIGQIALSFRSHFARLRTSSFGLQT